MRGISKTESGDRGGGHSFAYQSQVDGRLYDTVELKPGVMTSSGAQTEGYFKMLSPDGTPDPFAVLYEGYYIQVILAPKCRW